MSDYAVVNPATGETVKTYETISDDALKDAIARSDAAHRELNATTTVEDRAAFLRRIGELHTEQRQRLSEIIVREMGKPIEQALAEVDFCAAIYEFYADNAPKLLADEPIDLLDGDGSAFIRRSSYGVLLGIMPWNFPYYQVARFAGPNLAIGNTILLKHAPQCPESAEAIEQLYQEAGVPADAYINIYATNEQIESVIADPRVRGVSLTGSERAGAAVAEIAGRNLKKVVLELGGSDPFILLSTDDLDGAVENAVAARVDNTGQSCNAAKRFIVVDELYDAVPGEVHRGDHRRQAGRPDLGRHRDRPAVVGDGDGAARRPGAPRGRRRRQAGGRRRPGRELLLDHGADRHRPGEPARYEEFFGPVASVYRVGSEEEAVELANDTPFGLGSYVMTTDPDQALRIADRIEAGMVFVNLVGADGAELPFGGVKRSGFGRELGRYGIDEFVNKKLIRIGG